MKTKKVMLLLLVCALAFLVLAGAANAKRVELKATVTGAVTYIPNPYLGQNSYSGLWTVTNAKGRRDPWVASPCIPTIPRRWTIRAIGPAGK